MFRWFSYGVAYTPGLRFEPLLSRAQSDVWLLLPRPPVASPADPGPRRVAGGLRRGSDRLGARRLDVPGGRDGARALPRAPPATAAGQRSMGAVVPPAADGPHRPRGEVKLPEIESPLALYELRSTLPRAFWVPRHRLEPDAGRLRLRLEDPAFDPRSVVLLPQEPASVPAEAEPTGACAGHLRERSTPTPSVSGRPPRPASSSSSTVTTRTGGPRIGRDLSRFTSLSDGTRPSRPGEVKPL